MAQNIIKYSSLRTITNSGFTTYSESLLSDGFCGFYKSLTPYKINHQVYSGGKYWKALTANTSVTPVEGLNWTEISAPATWSLNANSSGNPSASVIGSLTITFPSPIVITEIGTYGSHHSGRAPEEGGSYSGYQTVKLDTGSGYGSDICGEVGSNHNYNVVPDPDWIYTTRTTGVIGVQIVLYGAQSGGIQPAGAYIDLAELEIWAEIGGYACIF